MLRPVRVPGPGGLNTGEQGGVAAAGKAPKLSEWSLSGVWGGGEALGAEHEQGLGRSRGEGRREGEQVGRTVEAS